MEETSGSTSFDLWLDKERELSRHLSREKIQDLEETVAANRDWLTGYLNDLLDGGGGLSKVTIHTSRQRVSRVKPLPLSTVVVSQSFSKLLLQLSVGGSLVSPNKNRIQNQSKLSKQLNRK